MVDPQQSTQPNPQMLFGRERILNEIVQGSAATPPQSFVIVGAKLAGKSALLRHLVEIGGSHSGGDNFQATKRLFVAMVDCLWSQADCDPWEEMYNFLTQQLRTMQQIELNWPDIESQPSVVRHLGQLAHQLRQQGYQLALLLDNFDRLVRPNPAAPPLHHALHLLTQEATLILTTKQSLHDLDEDGLNSNGAGIPLGSGFVQRFLGLLEPAATQAWLSSILQQFPDLESLQSELTELTGRHPFLLSKLGASLAEVQQLLPVGSMQREETMPLLRLRLAEHGRPLFMALWHTFQNPPARIPPESIVSLLKHLLREPLAIQKLQPSQATSLNWLINQAVILISEDHGQPGYQLFSPLFTEFLALHLTVAPTSPARQISVDDVQSPLYEHLSKMEAALLRYLQKQGGMVVSTDQLLADVWKRPDSSTRRVQEAIRRLRLQLEQQTPPIGVIENDRGRGYRFIPANT